MVQLSVLSSLASLYSHACTGGGQKFFAFIEPHIPRLKKQWLNLLRDYAVIKTQNKPTQKNYNAHFFNSGTVDHVTDYYLAAWPSVLLACSSLVGTHYWEEKEGSSDTGEHPSSTTDDKENFILLLGLALFSLVDSEQAQHSSLCLGALGHLLGSKYIQEDLVPHVMFKEIADTVKSILEMGTPETKLQVMKLIQKLASSVPALYFDNSTGEILLSDFLGMTMGVLAFYIPQLFPERQALKVSTKSVQDEETVKQLQAAAVGAIASFPALFNSSMRSKYGSTLIYILVKVCEISTENPELGFLVSPTSEALKNLTKFEGPEWEQIVDQVLVHILEIIRRSRTASATLLPVLFSVFMDMNHAPSKKQLHQTVITSLIEILNLKDAKLSVIVMIGIRSIVTASISRGNQDLKDISGKLIRELSSHVLFQLQDLGNVQQQSGIPDGEDLNLATEFVRFLVLAQTIAPPPSQPALLSVVLPSLVSLLRPQSKNAIHDLSLQILMKLAQTQTAEFKVELLKLADKERIALETSIKQTMMQQQAAQQAAVATERKPLTLDFSKYSK